MTHDAASNRFSNSSRTDDPARLAYGTCAGCQQLKHVSADGLVRVHNRFEATGTVVSPSRCSGSGHRYQEAC